ncbi:MAG: FtsK/SpoIIIE domain-containing protein [Candidatus Pacearchaeota archaeon]|jgi:hypothetical protein
MKFLGKNLYNLFVYLKAKKIKRIPVALYIIILLFVFVSFSTKKTCLSLCIVVLTWILMYSWSFSKSIKYYNTRFEVYNLIKNNRSIKFVGLTYQDQFILYRFKTNIPLEELRKRKSSLEMALKTNIIEMELYGRSKSIYQFVTSKKKIDFKAKAKLSSQIQDKLFAAFRECNIKISNIEVIKEPYKKTICFDSNENKKALENSLYEIEHLTGLRNLKLYSDINYDYKIVLNKNIGIISFYTLVKNTNLTNKENMIVGLKNSGSLEILDIKKIYHSIVAGSTGKGKSNFSHVVCSSLIKSNLDIAMFLLDPKKSELKRYRDIDRVFYSGDHKEINNILSEIVKEMDRRNIMFEGDKFINNIEMWNNSKEDKLNYIIVYVEEIADLIMSSDEKDENSFKNNVTRLCQLGRSVGIRVFLSTQKPNAEIIPTIIKGNCYTRFGFATTNIIESRVILDNSMCCDLKQAGDMIFQNNGENIKLKVPLIEEKFIVNIVEYLEKNHNKKADYPLSGRMVEMVKSKLGVKKTGDQCDGRDPVATIIKNKHDLLDFYKKYCENEIFSSRITSEKVDIGKTKIQEYRKELIKDGTLIEKGKKTYLNKKINIIRLK